MEDNFDFNMNVDDLFNYNVLIMENAQPDIQVREIKHDMELTHLIEHEIGYGAIQAIVSNNDQETKERCPYFRIVATPPSSSIPKNYLFEAFLQRIGQGFMTTPRVVKALVIGLHALNNLESPITVPMAFCTTNIPEFAIDIFGEIDMACLEPIANRACSSESLVDIAGMCLPYHVPYEVQMRILLFCESPTAILVKNKMTNLCDNWDLALVPMFLQREPRIPPDIASRYNVAYVRRTIRDATKHFLVPAANPPEQFA